MVRPTRSLSQASRTSGDNISSASCAPAPKSPADFGDSISLASSADAEHFVEQENLESATLPDSDKEFHRRLFVMPSTSILGGQIHSLPHPRSGNPTLYLLDKGANPYELMRLDQGASGRRRSIFCGDTVIAEPGPILMFLPVHPFFLLLPRLLQVQQTSASTSDCFLPIHTILYDHQFPALRLLADNEKLVETLKLVADFDEENPPKFRLNKDKLRDWLKAKFVALKESLRKNATELGEADETDEHKIGQNSFGILADYLPESLAEELKMELDWTKPTAAMGQNSRKRPPAADPLGAFASPKAVPPAKKRISRVLAAASKGTQSLKSFFTGASHKKDEQIKKEEEQIKEAEG